MFSSSDDITSRVNSNLIEDPRTKDAQIDVTGTAGVVTLSGSVRSETVRQAAEEITRQTDGVVTVINEIRVRS